MSLWDWFLSLFKKKKKNMKGVCISLGLNSVDPKHYNNWKGKLYGCEYDAKDIVEITKKNGFETTLLLTLNATRSNLISELNSYSESLKANDLLVLYYSGHGGQIPDREGEEKDGKDETWCLYDGQFVDDELYYQLTKFKAGVRILVISDSCHSGTMTKDSYYEDLPLYKRMPRDLEEEVYQTNCDMYDEILHPIKQSKAIVYADVLLISGCQDNQLSSDGSRNGKFTGELLNIYKAGKTKNYFEFYTSIVKRMPPTQTPNYYFMNNDAFWKENKVFKI